VKTLSAQYRLLQPGFKWFAQHEMTEQKVAALVQHLRAGGGVPPPVLVDYSGSYMPLDGHHRTEAHSRLEEPMEAWVVKGLKFEDFCRKLRDEGVTDPESQVMCDGVPAPLVATRWNASVDRRQSVA